MRKFAFSLIITLAIVCVMVILDVIYKVILDRDDFWKIQWIFYACWFVIFTGFLFWVMILLRPNERSRLLMEIE